MSEGKVEIDWQKCVVSRTERLELLLSREEYNPTYDLLVLKVGYSLVSASVLPDERARLILIIERPCI